MIAYFVLFGIFTVLATVAELTRSQTFLLAIAAIILILAIGLRIEVGADWYVYQRIFNQINFNTFSYALQRTDIAYGLLNWLVAELGYGIIAVNFVCAMIFTFGLISLSRIQPNAVLTILAALPYLVIVVAMGYTRQSAAIGLMMLAIAQYSRGARLKMLLSLLLAAAFHRSAVLVIPMIAIASAKDRVTTALALILLTATTYYVFLASHTEGLIENYIHRGYSSSGAGIRIAMTVIPAGLFLWLRDRLGFDRNQRRLWMVFSIAAFIAQIALFVSPSSTAVDRVSLYLIPLQIVVLSRLPSAFGSEGRKSNVVVAALMVYLCAVQFVWFNFAAYSWAWIPYRNYLLPEPVFIPSRR